ncbi:TPA: hypothetical protein L4R50_000322 [Pseudomonas aeruginosa]|nr:hypothetical protein [Pseudomonas aeruginosa]HBP1602403.1 hypothetical protein [Pseudomonas aeruginosa]
MTYILGALLLLVAIFFFQKKSAASAVHSRFGVRESTHRLISTDLGNAKGRIKLSRFGINGIADAVFESIKGNEILVGEFKSRKYRGQVRLHEFYQLLLYMGHLKAQYPNHTVLGCLAYADSRVQVNFDPAVYEALLGLREEYWQTVKYKQVADSRPLHKRMKVSGQNRGLRFTTSL